MRLDINRVREVGRLIEEINRTPLAEIELYDGEARVEVKPSAVAFWEQTGLNNWHFFLDEMFGSDVEEGSYPCPPTT